MQHYRAYRIHRSPHGIEARLENLPIAPPAPGEVVIEASYSSINCDICTRAHRQQLWKRLATDLRPRRLDRIVTRQVSLEDLPSVFAAYLDGQVIGRTLVVIP
jgi:NADPH:quinone reductase-like Zn-dependent oxidoreductase